MIRIASALKRIRVRPAPQNAIRWFYDENGIPRSYVDEEKRRMLEIKLVTMILNFEIVKVA